MNHGLQITEPLTAGRFHLTRGHSFNGASDNIRRVSARIKCQTHYADDDDAQPNANTTAGETYLKDQQEMLIALLEKLRIRREIHNNDQLIEIHRAMENLKTALRLKLYIADLQQEKIYQIAEKIDQAAIAIGRL